MNAKYSEKYAHVAKSMDRSSPTCSALSTGA
eukprot:CAMPEP_0205906588 /NCGR_PEP_ID=MMETSP1325-20131115/2033_1 /ASSEMBLY_ACC=CAM_ASM_000708 /TAXON_ID=236786 /ORGANISM="Florenciella sp., Strain RCC1007" /LENGTH=30 /DNA_ID= /DNA_START= /DNA_END= /DNA_ORIENTATION=